MSKFFRVFVVLVLVGMLGLVPSKVLALANPTSTSIITAGVFSSVVDTGDQWWIVHYNVNYATVPATPASQTFLFAIYDTDGTTLLFQRLLNYYQENLISIYLTPAQALTIGSPYVVRIMGNPGVFPSLIEGINQASQTLSAGQYYPKASLGTWILAVFTQLQTNWGITLISAAGLLNTTGTNYASIAVPGITSVVPEIFETSVVYPTVEPRSTNTTYSDDLLENKGASLNTTIHEMGSWLGTTDSWMSLGMVGLLACIVMGTVFGATKRPEWAVIMGFLCLAAAVPIGLLSLQIFLVMLSVAFIFFVLLFVMFRWAG